ncbi:DnaJ C-terminal domain-containing protein [Sphingomonas morindae]|uniref:DnaJ domain-containing protein n=1 Tax=Sphingomonas morindae TaxID=1541170 RepID=A0ABY4X3G3_9SPHN|nr:DnaJ C-terminal domain-containing protein [Sphingomonas morindae]USI71428.1 DnaJ domain-containing protein [Sphingomonas morindae]
MADPYQILGVARGADEATIKKAYRTLAKELHPDRNADNPKAAERFSAVTAAYDLLSDKDKRARFDRGEIDADGNARAPFGFGGGGASPFGGGAGPFGARGFRAGPGPGGAGGFGQDGADFGDIFDNLFSGGAAGGGGGGPFGGFGRRGTKPQAKGADVAYRLQVPFEDAAALKPQRVTLGNGKTIELKLPPGVESGTQRRLGGQGEPGPTGPGDAIVTIEIQPHRFFTREGDDVRLDLPITLKEAMLGGKVKVPTVDGAVMVTIPKGSSSGRTLRLGGKGFHRSGGGRGDQLVTLMIELPGQDAALEQFLAGWTDAPRSPRADLGV